MEAAGIEEASRGNGVTEDSGESSGSLGGLPFLSKTSIRSRKRPSTEDCHTVTNALGEALHHLDGGRVDLARVTLERLVAQLKTGVH